MGGAALALSACGARLFTAFFAAGGTAGRGANDSVSNA
jgi:hypothetical protein